MKKTLGRQELRNSLQAIGCWLLAISWPYLSIFLTVYQFDFIGKEYSELMRNHGLTKFIITPLFHYIPSFVFLCFLPYSNKRKMLNGLLLFLIHGIIFLSLMLIISSGTRY